MITKELFKKYWVDEGANEKIRQSIMLEEYAINELTYDELIQHITLKMYRTQNSKIQR